MFESEDMADISLKVNGRLHTVDGDPQTPLLYVLSDDLQLRGPTKRYRLKSRYLSSRVFSS